MVSRVQAPVRGLSKASDRYGGQRAGAVRRKVAQGVERPLNELSCHCAASGSEMSDCFLQDAGTIAYSGGFESSLRRKK